MKSGTVTLLVFPSLILGSVVTLQDSLSDSPLSVEYISIPGGLDGQKLHPGPQDSSYDWWYFDAVSASSNQSVTVVFYESGPNGFINNQPGGPLSVGISGSFANGSTFNYEVPALCGAEITDDDSHISGVWAGSGCEFAGTRWQGQDDSYVISIDAPAVGIQGSVVLRSRAPAHYPCGPRAAGLNEELSPHVFWSNAVPDATAAVDLIVEGEPILFYDGVGYHDKLWGDAPFVNSVSSWYWGHAQLGPYSIVWYDILSSVSQEFFSAYVSQDGVIISSSCRPEAVVVRPWGLNSDYPPTTASGVMQGLTADFELEDTTTLSVNVTTELVVIDVGVYVRALGSVSGGIRGSGVDFEGRALFEEFKFTGPSSI